MISLERLHEIAATLNKAQVARILHDNGVLPGTAEYMKYRRYLLPLEIRLGHSKVQTRTRSLNSEVVIWCPARCSNPSMMVLGSSGSGKTETLRVIGKTVLDHGIPLLIIDFHGDLDLDGVQTVLMSSGRSSTIGVNPLELATQDPELVGLIEQRSALVGMLKRAIPSLSPHQQHMLNLAMEQAYRERDISDKYPDTWGNEPPSFRYVLDVLDGWLYGKAPPRYRESSIAGCMQAIESLFEHPVFYREENLSAQQILNSCTRVDLSYVDDRVRFIVAETLLRKVFYQLQMQGPIPYRAHTDEGPIRLFVLIDEAKILSMGRGSPERVDLILNKIATEGRKYGIALILASQMSDHFGADVRSNMGSRLILKQNDFFEAKQIAVDIQESPNTLLTLHGNGDGLFRTGIIPETTRVQIESLSQRSRNTLLD